MIQSKLELLTSYAALNMPKMFNQLLKAYTVTFDITPLITHIKTFYRGYTKQSMIINLLNIHEEEIAFMNAETFISL
jgi:hypothetical protein